MKAVGKEHIPENAADTSTSEATPKAKEHGKCVIKPIKHLMDIDEAVWNKMLHKYNFSMYGNNLQDLILEGPLQDWTEIPEYLTSLVQKVKFYTYFNLSNTAHLICMWSIVCPLKF